MIQVENEELCSILLNKIKKIEISLDLSMKDLYLSSFYLAQSILDIFSEKYPSEKKAVDIRGLATAFQVEIIEKNLQLDSCIFTQGMLGYLDYYNHKYKEYPWTIYVNNNMGSLTKRYVIAHELAHFFLNYSLCKGNISCYTNPLFPKKEEEQLCDIIACFLLMPIDKVLELMKKYIENCKSQTNCSVDMYDWLTHLGSIMGVSDYHTVSCFQNVRYLGGIIFESKGEWKKIGEKDYCAQVYEKMKEYPSIFLG